MQTHRPTRLHTPRLTAALLALVGVAACDDSSKTNGSSGGDAASTGEMGLPPPVDNDLGGNLDVGPQDAAPPPRDIEPDFPPEPDFPIPDVLPPDGPPPPGDAGLRLDFGEVMGEDCDPRLRAAACGPGFYCVHEQGRPEFVGHCAEGDGCTPGDPAGCPDPARPYCHVQGAATFCTAAGVGRDGDDCVDRDDVPQPCAEGFVCTFSVCRTACNPDMPMCADNFRCESYEGATGERFGICQPPACDWFTARGCEAGQKCAYAIRGDGQVVGSCTPLEGPGNQADAPCSVNPGGGDNCGVGLICTGPPNGERHCKILCDTGGYQAPCPDGLRCVEALATANGNVHGLGICITNQ